MGHGETSLGGPGRSFPSTCWSDVLAAGDANHAQARERLERLLRMYWKPIYVCIRAYWHKSVEDAKDLTQSFIAMFLEKEYLSRLRPEGGTFRGYLKVALRNFLLNAARSEVRRTERPTFSIDAIPGDVAQLEVSVAGTDPDKAFDREWFRVLMEGAMSELQGALERAGKAEYYEVFRSYCLPPPEGPAAPEEERTYAELAARLGKQVHDVRNRLSYCRRILRQILRERIRDYVAVDADVERELNEAAGS